MSTTISIFIGCHSTAPDILRATPPLVDGSEVPTTAKLTGAQGTLMAQLTEGVT